MLRESRQLEEHIETHGYSPVVPKPFEGDVNPLIAKGPDIVAGMADYFG